MNQNLSAFVKGVVAGGLTSGAIHASMYAAAFLNPVAGLIVGGGWLAVGLYSLFNGGAEQIGTSVGNIYAGSGQAKDYSVLGSMIGAAAVGVAAVKTAPIPKHTRMEVAGKVSEKAKSGTISDAGAPLLG